VIYLWKKKRCFYVHFVAHATYYSVPLVSSCSFGFHPCLVIVCSPPLLKVDIRADGCASTFSVRRKILSGDTLGSGVVNDMGSGEGEGYCCSSADAVIVLMEEISTCWGVVVMLSFLLLSFFHYRHQEQKLREEVYACCRRSV
jgi:hypothetical protein